MKAIFLALLLLCSNAFAQELYNSIATAYVTTTISQNVVFNSTMRQGGTFTFSVLAHNGGGRAGQSDTANVRIEFYNSSGGLITSVNTSHSNNLPNPNNVCGNPCIDPAVPWTTLTTSATLNSTQAANVAYARVSMYGIDGSFWAGDYGPWYRAPTFTHNGGANLAYNPEFGPYNGIQAQGWTTSPALGACQGAWGGSNPCIANSSGQPGTSTTGLVANQFGGGPDPNGGTTLGTAGGYNSTMTTSSPTGAPPPPPPPNWQPIRTNSSPVVISNIFPTSNNSPAGEGAANAFDGNPNTKYLNFDKKNAGVTVQLSQGRVVQKFTITTANDFSGRDPTSYKLYGSNDGINWVLIKADTLNLSDTRFWTSPEILVTNTTAYVYYFILFPTTKAGDGCGLNCDSMQIAEITFYYDSNDGVTSTLIGSGGTPSNPGTAGSICADCGPTVVGGTITQTNASSNQTITSGAGSAVIKQQQQTRITNWNSNYNGQTHNNYIYIDQVSGSLNTVTVTQTTASGKNHVEATIAGTGSNTIGMTQTGTNYHKLDANGAYNSIITQQSNNSTSSNFKETTVTGNNNIISTNQKDNANKIMFNTVTGNNNTVTAVQEGTGSHYLENALNGNGLSSTVSQSGSTANNAVINLTNSGGPASVDLQQSGGKSFNLIQGCANPAGCTTVVRQ